jgi:hypothetical protein
MTDTPLFRVSDDDTSDCRHCCYPIRWLADDIWVDPDNRPRCVDDPRRWHQPLPEPGDLAAALADAMGDD